MQLPVSFISVARPLYRLVVFYRPYVSTVKYGKVQHTRTKIGGGAWHDSSAVLEILMRHS